MKWAPHLADPAGPSTRPPSLAVADSPAGLEALLAGELAGRPWVEPGTAAPTDRSHLLLVTDGVDLGGGQLGGPQGLAGVTVLQIGGRGDLPTDRSMRLRVTDRDLLTVAVDRVGQEVTTYVGIPDQVTAPAAAATCRAIAGLRLPEDRSAEPATAAAGLPDLLGLATVRALDPAISWRPRPPRDRLRVAIGVGGDGRPVELDLKEAAEGGMGPHGLVVGATGSGKSELLRTLVLGLAITHPPDALNFVLVDFKGGATFTRLDGLPHTSAVITNLSDHLDLVDRMRDALAGELTRRMEILRAAGNVASLRDYDRARAAGRDLPAAVAAGRSRRVQRTAHRPARVPRRVRHHRAARPIAGVHLLLASQRLDEGRLRGLDSHLSYRIGLKTFSAAESRIVLGADDAFRLPTARGNGYLRYDTSVADPLRCRVRVGPVRDRQLERASDGWPSPGVQRLALSSSGAHPQDRPEPAGGDGRRCGSGWRADAARTGGVPVGGCRRTGPRGLAAAAAGSSVAGPAAARRTAAGRRIRPDPARLGGPRAGAEPRNLELDLSGAAGHVAIVGALGEVDRSAGLVCALALTHGPAGSRCPSTAWIWVAVRWPRWPTCWWVWSPAAQPTWSGAPWRRSSGCLPTASRRSPPRGCRRWRSGAGHGRPTRTGPRDGFWRPVRRGGRLSAARVVRTLEPRLTSIAARFEPCRRYWCSPPPVGRRSGQPSRTSSVPGSSCGWATRWTRTSTPASPPPCRRTVPGGD